MIRKFSLFVLILLMLPGVFALGVTPGRTTIDFEPSLERDVGFRVTNTEGKAMRVAFTVEGDLADFVSLTNEVQNFAAGEGSKQFRYTLNLPDSLSPGLHKAEVVVLELPEEGLGEGTSLSATVSVVTQLHVRVPYPGKYVDVSFDIVSNDESNLVNFYLPLISQGDEAIDSVSGVVRVYRGDELIETLETQDISIGPGERKELSAVWDPDVSEGSYLAVAEIVYDGEIFEIEQEFNIGEEELGLLGVSVNDFTLGDVARVRILVQNRLSETVEKANANLKVRDGAGTQIANLNSENYVIEPQENKELLLYWDTERLEAGNYDSALKIDFDEKSINKNFKVDVADDSISFTGVGFVIESGAGSKINTTTFLFIVIGFLVLVNVAWLVWWRKNRKRK